VAWVAIYERSPASLSLEVQKKTGREENPRKVQTPDSPFSGRIQKHTIERRSGSSLALKGERATSHAGSRKKVNIWETLTRTGRSQGEKKNPEFGPKQDEENVRIGQRVHAETGNEG